MRGLERRLDALRRAPAFRNYATVRRHVMEMRARGASTPEHRPSAYWAEELSNFEYMLDASPLIIEKLRQHSFHITGLRVYDYRTHRDKARARFEEKLRALDELAPAGLRLPERRELGGFGFDIGGELFNLDTLKFYEVLIALERAHVLAPFRGGGRRRLVWEIGAGWGGFAYQFRSLCPDVTYVITDFPELFLFSATYLMTLFPDAVVAFWDEASPAELLGRWETLDFIFVPNTALDQLRPPRLDLAINMVSFQEMTEAQVAAYVAHAYALECPTFYSLNRDRSGYNPEIDSVRQILARYYVPETVALLPVAYQKMLDDKPSASDYHHVVGRRGAPPTPEADR